MKKPFRYWVCCGLLACCACVVFAGQSVAFDEMLNGTYDMSNCHPFDRPPVVTEWKRIIASRATDPLSNISSVSCSLVPGNPRELLSLPITYTAIVAHFSCPPFRPRDPALS